LRAAIIAIAAAAAAVADEAHLPLDVLAELDEVVLVSPLQEAMHSDTVTGRMIPWRMREAAGRLKVMQMSMGASQAFPTWPILCRQ
jgi:hypothetical protein